MLIDLETGGLWCFENCKNLYESIKIIYFIKTIWVISNRLNITSINFIFYVKPLLARGY